MPKISIIVPVYNVEPYLSKCLDSLINQTFQDIEIICVDDCSPDNSNSIIKKYMEYDKRIKIIENNKNIGLSGSRNIGMQIAKAKYIMFLDPDDWYDKDACELLYFEIVKKDVDLALFGTRKVYSNKSKKKVKEFFYSNRGKISDNSINLLYNLDWSVWNKIWKKSILNKYDIIFPTGQNLEDAPFYFKYMAFVKKVSIIKKPKYNYLQRPDSIIGQLRHKKLVDLMFYVKAVEDVRLFFKKHNLLLRKKAILFVIADRFIGEAISIAGIDEKLIKPIVKQSSVVLSNLVIDNYLNRIGINYDFISALKSKNFNFFYKLNSVKRKSKLGGIIKIIKTYKSHKKIKEVIFLGIKIIEQLETDNIKQIKFLNVLIWKTKKSPSSLG